jgi:hypothetical protein
VLATRPSRLPEYGRLFLASCRCTSGIEADHPNGTATTSGACVCGRYLASRPCGITHPEGVGFAQQTLPSARSSLGHRHTVWMGACSDKQRAVDHLAWVIVLVGPNAGTPSQTHPMHPTPLQAVCRSEKRGPGNICERLLETPYLMLTEY